MNTDMNKEWVPVLEKSLYDVNFDGCNKKSEVRKAYFFPLFPLNFKCKSRYSSYMSMRPRNQWLKGFADGIIGIEQGGDKYDQ